MQNKKLNSLMIILSVMVNFISCKTLPEKKIDSAYIMVYDYENSEVMNVTLYLDDKELGKTDIYGRFTFPVDDEKVHVIKAVKEGYEKVEQEMILKPGILIYFKLGSGKYYAKEAEKLLDENKYGKALSMINNALKIEERKDWKYMKEVIIKRMEK